MKYLTLIAIILFSLAKKNQVKLIPLSSINVTNAIVGGATAKLGSHKATIANNGFTQFGLISGDNSLYVYPATDSLHPYFVKSSFIAEETKLYSLFLAGTTITPEGIIVEENIPYRTDSSAGIRFINLAPNTNAKPINITLSTTATFNEVTGLAYKNLTDFKSYLGLSTSAYTFQIRNDTSASPKPPLATFALTTATVPRFANITLVIRQNGASGVAIFRVNNDR